MNNSYNPWPICYWGSFPACTVQLGYTGTLTGVVGVVFPGITIVASDGHIPYVYGEIGTLPNGLTLNTSTGVVSGTPTNAGDFPVTFNVTDAFSCVAVLPLTLTISPSPVLAVTDHGLNIVNGNPSFSLPEILAGTPTVLLIATPDGGEIVSVTDGINNYSFLISRVGAHGVEIWYCLNPLHVPANTNLIVNYHTSGVRRSVQVYTMNQSVVVEAGASGGGVASQHPSIALSGVSDGSAVFAMIIGAGNGNPISQSPGWSGAVPGLINSGGTLEYLADGYLTANADGTYTYTPTGWPTGSSAIIYRAVIASFH